MNGLRTQSADKLTIDAAALEATGSLSLAQTTPRASGFYVRTGKRLFDLTVSTAILVIASPLLFWVWVVLRLTLGPDVVITQDRVGLNGDTFPMYKFRTMKWSRRSRSANFEGPDRRQSHKVDTDPRHTPIGRVLRKVSVDELPQLLNVVNGTMSLVGPRPELVSLVDEMGERGHPRHSVRPGMTGEWQVTDRQSGALLHESFDKDLPYLERVTFRNDLTILFQTIGVVFSRGGR